MSSYGIRHRQHGSARVALLLIAFLVLSIIGVGAVVAGYHYLFNRAGEAATTLIPADSAVVVTVDAGPSPSQVGLFGRMTLAMKREQVDKPIKQAAFSSPNGATFYQDTLPLLGTSYALALWKKTPDSASDDMTGVGMASIKSPSDVVAVVAKHGTALQKGDLTYYQITKEKLYVAVINDYLVVSDSVDPLMRIQSVSKGQSPSVGSVTAFQQARDRLPSEANLMLFVGPKAQEQTKKQLEGFQATAKMIRAGDWIAMGTTLRDKGIETVCNAPLDGSNAIIKTLAGIAPIDPGLYKRLPGGAYGVLVVSQPGRFYAMSAASLDPGSDVRKSFDQGLEEFTKETQLSLPNDLIPGLLGHIALAVYPAAKNPTVPDGLIVLDDANGSDPGAMLDKIRASIDRELTKNKQPALKLTSTQSNGATIWTPDDASQDTIFSRKKSNDLSGRPGSDGDNVFNGKTPNDPGAPTGGGNGSSNPLADKKLVWAQLGKVILIASSQEMMDRAIETYTSGKSSMADDPAYVGMLKQVTPGAQYVLLVDAPNIMEHLRPQIASSSPGKSSADIDSIVKLFGSQGTGLVISYAYNSATMSGTLFIPLDYEQAIHLVDV